MYSLQKPIEPENYLYELIVRQTSDAIIFVDENGVIRIWNYGAESIFGYTSSEAWGQSLDMIIPEHLRQAHWHGFSTAIKNGVAKNIGKILTTRSTHKNGKRIYVDFSFCVIKNSAGVVMGALATGRDCTVSYQNVSEQRQYILELEGKLALKKSV